jgi:hypothetical protein
MFLQIPFDDTVARSVAKSLGGKWNPSAKLWKLSDKTDLPTELCGYLVASVPYTPSCADTLAMRFEALLRLLEVATVQADLDEYTDNVDLVAGSTVASAPVSKTNELQLMAARWCELLATVAGIEVVLPNHPKTKGL